MRVDIKIAGLDKLSERVLEVQHKVINEVAIGLYQGTELVMTESKKEVPVDFGNLRATGHVQQPVIEGAKVTVHAGYGGPAARYAFAVHEGTGIYGPEGKPFVITAKNKKILAVPFKNWGDRPVNPYGSKKFPMLSKDGKFVLLGRRVKQKGIKGRKYLERPLNSNKDKIKARVDARVARALKEG
ncbi:hypothetical protein [Tumebacillus permanentifrigoris]|uniref:HK97 gp10 family phage protein n=1 Tax=Tumebacillus permanentifrigoris TaxID=378543 RepID=A0A316D6I5_9BACL|nr:hypothetical protein [Tumebacillus permanentifrigoris]PWK07501.1 hypothetical protein C7459_117100 [Tumebacillus permanentifrigoris]